MNIKEFSNNYNRYFLHTLSNFNVSSNTVINDNVGLKEKISLIRSHSPELSCSSIISNKPHNGNDFANSRMGVILGDGDIIYASKSDAGSVAQLDGTRHIIGDKLSNEEITNNILYRQSNDGYNEIVIKNPKIAGIYFVFDPKGENLEEQTKNDKVWDTCNSLVEKFDILKGLSKQNIGNSLPTFAILNGQVRQIYGLNVNLVDKYLISEKSNNLYFDSNHWDIPKSDMEKIQNWKTDFKDKKLSEIVDKIFNLGPPLDNNDLYKLSNNNKLSEELKNELVQKNGKLLKNNNDLQNDTDILEDHSIITKLNLSRILKNREQKELVTNIKNKNKYRT